MERLTNDEIGVLLFAARHSRTRLVGNTVALMRKFGEEADLSRQEQRMDWLDSAIRKLRSMKKE